MVKLENIPIAIKTGDSTEFIGKTTDYFFIYNHHTHIPVAYRMDDSALVRTVGEVPRTPMRSAIVQTIEAFERL